MQKTLKLFIAVLIYSGAVTAQESVIDMGAMAQPRERSKWSYSYFNLSSVGQEAVIAGGAQVFSYNYLSANYHLSREEKISLRPTFYYSTAGYDYKGDYQPQKTELGDAYVQYTRYGLALLPGEIGLSGMLKGYFPTSEASKMKRMSGKIGGELVAEKALGSGWEINYRLKPDYYLQSQTTYLKKEDKVNKTTGEKYQVTRIRATDYFDIEQSLDIKKRLRSDFALGMSLGLEDNFDYGSSKEKIEYRRSEDFSVAVNAEVNFTRKFSMIFSMENSQSVYRPKNDFRPKTDFKLFRAEDTDYTVLTFWSI